MQPTYVTALIDIGYVHVFKCCRRPSMAFERRGQDGILNLALLFSSVQTNAVHAGHRTL